jgi:hypothetical protein
MSNRPIVFGEDANNGKSKKASKSAIVGEDAIAVRLKVFR